MAHNFNKYGHDRVDVQNIPYDFNSILHYNGKAFSKNGKPTIKKIGAGSFAAMGQRNGFSNDDIIAINKLYSCNGKGEP
jgi:hypothetical protein